ncbi:pentapeptide repeat-containing protein [Streptomyces sp. NPDC055099]
MSTSEPPTWPHCAHGADPAANPVGCRGIYVPGHTACLAHLTDVDRDAYLAGLTPGTSIDHRGTTFTDSLFLALRAALCDPATGVVRLGDAGFESATFEGGADFGSATFEGGADFGSATFEGGADFGSATFEGGARFGSATFKDHTAFRAATVEGGARFGSATFEGDAGFLVATFESYADFRASIFEGDAVFGAATFESYAEFRSATFESDADFESATFKTMPCSGRQSSRATPGSDRRPSWRPTASGLWCVPDGLCCLVQCSVAR